MDSSHFRFAPILKFKVVQHVLGLSKELRPPEFVFLLCGKVFFASLLDDLHTFLDGVAKPKWIANGSRACLLAFQLHVTVSTSAFVLQHLRQGGVVREN